jgi:hypothetical protein
MLYTGIFLFIFSIYKKLELIWFLSKMVLKCWNQSGLNTFPNSTKLKANGAEILK